MLGQTLGHYRLVEKNGEGGMGVVYRARDLRLGRDIALKVLPTGNLSDDTARQRFRREALALAKLDHPNVQTVHDFDSQGGVDFLVSEYIAGETLTERLHVQPLPQDEEARLGKHSADGPDSRN
jgi:serine/threonine protein kinase